MKKKTMQLLLRELFLIVKTHKNGKRSLILDKSPLITPGPTVICPVNIYGVRTSIGFCVDSDSIPRFYLFDTETPHLEESRERKIVMELKGGRLDIRKNYINRLTISNLNMIPFTTEKISHDEKVEKEANYALIIQLIIGEVGRLMATKEFIAGEKIRKDEFVKLAQLNNDNYKNLSIVVSDKVLY